MKINHTVMVLLILATILGISAVVINDKPTVVEEASAVAASELDNHTVAIYEAGGTAWNIKRVTEFYTEQGNRCVLTANSIFCFPKEK